MEQLPERLQISLPTNSGVTDEISLYTGELTPKAVVNNIANIKKAFPGLPAGFYDVFTDRIKENGFCDERLRDAVSHVIDNCIYPQPTIAQFISYDKTLKFKTHDQMCKDESWGTYLPVKFPDRPKVIWVHANDIKLYKLNKYVVK